jgi:hypothetical protein
MMYFCKGTFTTSTERKELFEEPTNVFQPLVLDLLNEMSNGFIYMDSDKRKYYSPSADINYDLGNFLKKTKFTGSFKEHPISTPHFSSFVDLNGDCYPDLVLTAHDELEKKFYIEYWFRIADGKYELYDYTTINNIENPEQISLFIIADFGINFCNS